MFSQKPDQTNSFWNVASSVELVNWLWVTIFFPPLSKGREGCNLGSRLRIHLVVTERVQRVWLELFGDL